MQRFYLLVEDSFAVAHAIFFQHTNLEMFAKTHYQGRELINLNK